MLTEVFLPDPGGDLDPPQCSLKTHCQVGGEKMRSTEC